MQDQSPLILTRSPPLSIIIFDKGIDFCQDWRSNAHRKRSEEKVIEIE